MAPGSSPLPPLSLGPAVVLATAADGYLAYDLAADRLDHLNPTAALIVELCDGTRDRAAIAAAVGPLLGPGAATACADWLAGAVDTGLVREGPPTPPDGRTRSARDLVARADRLRDDGRVLAAYVCQSRAAELAPDDAEVLYYLGELAHMLGRRDVARDAYGRYLELTPDDAEVGHLLSALRDDAPPPRAPDRCIDQLYRRFAGSYDQSMRAELEYQAPERLEEAIAAVAPGAADLAVIDLGCGTGLAGPMLRRRARRLVGVDLSPAMLERARARRLYDELHAAEITEWLGRVADEPADLIAACDSLIYFGDLAQVIAPAARRLARGGLIALTVERADAPPFRLTDSGRYAHHPDHVRAVAIAAGLDVARLSEVTLRTEYGVPVVGLVAVLRLA